MRDVPATPDTIPARAGGALRFLDLAPARDGLRADVLAGLRARPRSIPPKYFYDAEGARLFERICRLPEYYLTRTEYALLQARLPEIAAVAGRVDCVIEPGAGGCGKVRLLIEALRPARVYALDIASAHLAQAAQALARDHPGLEVSAVGLDFVHGLEALAPHLPAAGRRLVFYPGSSIGNFTPEEAVALLGRFHTLAGPDGGLLVGVDLKKDPERLHRAYNDAQGVTAAFNLNLLARLNRELGADFAPGAFRHYAYYNPVEGRIEMHLVSLAAQTVHVAGEHFEFAAGESLHTENSYKYRPEEFVRLAAAAGWRPAGQWLDAEGGFALQYYAAGSGVG